jgi:hypothetical protein
LGSQTVEKALDGFFNIVIRTPLSRIPRQLSAVSQDWHKRSQLTCFAAFRRPVWQRGFQMTHIFDGLQPSKMPVHPCTGRSLPKYRVFQQAARTIAVQLTLMFLASVRYSCASVDLLRRQ